MYKKDDKAGGGGVARSDSESDMPYFMMDASIRAAQKDRERKKLEADKAAKKGVGLGRGSGVENAEMRLESVKRKRLQRPSSVERTV